MANDQNLKRPFGHAFSFNPASRAPSATGSTSGVVAPYDSLGSSDPHNFDQENVDPRSRILKKATPGDGLTVQNSSNPTKSTKEPAGAGDARESANQERALQPLPANKYPCYYAPAASTSLSPPSACSVDDSGSSEAVVTSAADALDISRLSLDSPLKAAAPPALPASSAKKLKSGKGPSTIPSEHIKAIFGELSRNDVVIVYARGTQMVKIDKDLLCSYSGFFSHAFDGPFLDRLTLAEKESYTRCIRIRDDFPYAIRAMISFITNGYYPLEPEMVAKHPLITMLDLHVHAYVVSDKYDVPALGEWAIYHYTQSAGDILDLNFDDGLSGMYDGSMASPAEEMDEPDRPMAEPYHPGDHSPIADVNRFLDSVFLLWKNTSGGHDAMRKAVLELIKVALTKLIKVKFFRVMLANIKDFEEDLNDSMREDGMNMELMRMGANDRYVIRMGGRGRPIWPM